MMALKKLFSTHYGGSLLGPGSRPCTQEVFDSSSEKNNLLVGDQIAAESVSIKINSLSRVAERTEHTHSLRPASRLSHPVETVRWEKTLGFWENLIPVSIPEEYDSSPGHWSR